MKIFLDVDGVLADFEKHLLDIYKIDINTINKDEIPWDYIGYEFYSTIPIFDGAKNFYKTISDLYNVYILSGTILTPGCYSGKAEWIKTVLGDNLYDLRKVIFCLSKNKKLLAAPGRILIDDFGRNINEWIQEGGIGIKILNKPTNKTWNNLLDFLDTSKIRSYKCDEFECFNPDPY
ncbi:MAG: hypothetical protein H7836_04825 [Magnetococcus sp. YQC-3]